MRMQQIQLCVRLLQCTFQTAQTTQNKRYAGEGTLGLRQNLSGRMPMDATDVSGGSRCECVCVMKCKCCKQTTANQSTDHVDCHLTSYRQDIQGASMTSSQALPGQQEGCGNVQDTAQPQDQGACPSSGQHTPSRPIQPGPATPTSPITPCRPNTGPHTCAGVACTSTARTDSRVQHRAAHAGQRAWSYVQQIKGSAASWRLHHTHLNTHRMHKQLRLRGAVLAGASQQRQWSRQHYRGNEGCPERGPGLSGKGQRAHKVATIVGTTGPCCASAAQAQNSLQGLQVLTAYC